MNPSTSGLLTLLEGSSIHLPHGAKRIPKELFSRLITAQEMLETLEKQAINYKQQVTESLESIREEAYREGFAQGFDAWLEKIQELEQEIQKVRTDVEKMVTPVALKAAKKIVAKEIETCPKTIQEIVRHHLKAVAQHKKITIWVNPEDFLVVDQGKGDLKTLFEHLEAFSVRPRPDVTQGGCVIETELGIINASIENQWARIEKAFARQLV